MIDVSEIEDCTNTIENQGFELIDFEFISTQDSTDGQETHPLTGKIIISRKSNGAEKTYESGHASTWPAQFGDDLRNGYFGYAI